GFIYHEQSGGGCCIDVGVHILDLALHLMGKFDPVCVTGVSVTKLARQKDVWSEWGGSDYDKKNLDVEDFAAGFVRFADGSALSLECSFMVNMKPRNENRIDLYGTKRGAKWPDCEVYDHNAGDYVDTKVDVRSTGTRAHHEEIRAFAEAVMGDTDVPVPPEESRAVMAILDGLYRSQKTGREVKLR
ncbi:MAG: Gfo/Idh/MocA family protein, partial [Planctomycetota bacterium]